MSAARTIRKLARATLKEALPFAQLGADAARRSLDELAHHAMGDDFEDRLRRASLSVGESGVDPFGLDPDWAKYAVSVAAFFHRIYFRSEVSGVERVPPGRVLLVANHSGQIPIDGLLIGAALFLDAEPPRLIRSMVEKWSQTLPFISTAFARVGQVVGVPENARRLLSMDEALLVFPEGIRGISKPFSERYKLCEFGLGFMRLALETYTPIVPVAVVGAEEQYISLGNMDRAAKALGLPSLPVIPQLFFPGGLAPLPTKYRLYFGEPMHFSGDPDDDDAVIEEKVQRVRSTIQSMLNRGIKDRKAIFW